MRFFFFLSFSKSNGGIFVRVGLIPLNDTVLCKRGFRFDADVSFRLPPRNGSSSAVVIVAALPQNRSSFLFSQPLK